MVKFLVIFENVLVKDIHLPVVNFYSDDSQNAEMGSGIQMCQRRPVIGAKCGIYFVTINDIIHN